MPTTYAIPNGRTVFDATTYTGTGANRTITNNDLGTVGFKPDLVWTKNRDTTGYEHLLFDSVRGFAVNKDLCSNTADAEGSISGSLYGYVSSAVSNGYTVVDGSSANDLINQSSKTYVAWQWQAGQGTTTTNNVGSISSQTSVNTTAGFSIVTYTGNGVNSTVGHGLSSAPKFLIVKNRVGVYNWRVWHSALSGTQFLYLNATDSTVTNAAMWNSTIPTSSVLSLGTNAGVNNSGDTFVAYCWSEVAGFSQFGSYTGNGSADGPFIYTGFRPSFLLVKQTNTSGQVLSSLA
jgi:hypothetical protein